MLHGTRPEGKRAPRSQGRAPQTKPAPSSPSPEPPDFLGKHAATLWRDLAPSLHRDGRLTSRYLSSFEMLCYSYGLWRVAIASTPKKITGKGYPPSLAVAQRAEAAFKSMALRFGLDPASCSRLTEMSGLGGGAGDAPTAPGPAAPEERDAAWHRSHGSGSA